MKTKTLEQEVKDAVFELYGGGNELMNQMLWVPDEVASVIDLLIEKGVLKYNRDDN